MGTIAIGFAFGLALGAGSGSQAGAFIGAVLGAMLAGMFHGVRWLWKHSGDHPVREHHMVMCTPHGRFADVEVDGDADRGHWLDVHRCSLEPTGAQPDCDRTCVRLLEDARVRPGKPCDCPAHAADGPVQIHQAPART